MGLSMVVWLCLSLVVYGAPLSADNGTIPASVVSVLDGDTITVVCDGRLQRIRLYGIDAPETAQEYGMEAKQTLKSVIDGRTVSIVPGHPDKYGRVVARVVSPDVGDLSVFMARTGSAWWYRQFTRAATDIMTAQEAARSSGIGLWSRPRPVPPWVWRHQRR